MFGGTYGPEVKKSILDIQESFQGLVRLLKSLTYDILDVKATRWGTRQTTPPRGPWPALWETSDPVGARVWAYRIKVAPHAGNRPRWVRVRTLWAARRQIHPCQKHRPRHRRPHEMWGLMAQEGE